jgi:transposase-like protein
VGRRGYPPEFRRKVLDLVESGRSAADVARDLELSEQSIYVWRRQDRRSRPSPTRARWGRHLLGIPPLAFLRYPEPSRQISLATVPGVPGPTDPSRAGQGSLDWASSPAECTDGVKAPSSAGGYGGDEVAARSGVGVGR